MRYGALSYYDAHIDEMHDLAVEIEAACERVRESSVKLKETGQ